MLQSLLMINKKIKAFTLIELMVVVAIMAIMSVGASVGFQSFFQYVTVQNASGYLQTVISQLSTEVSDNDYKKSSVYFEDRYLLVDSRSVNADLTLGWEKVLVATPDCQVGDIKLKSSDDAQLLEGGANDTPSTVQMSQNEEICVNPFKYKEPETIYDLQAGRAFSNQIRIFPLDLEKGNSSGAYIEANDYQLDILGQYGKKKRYKAGNLLDDSTPATLIIKSTDGEAEVTFDLPKKN